MIEAVPPLIPGGGCGGGTGASTAKAVPPLIPGGGYGGVTGASTAKTAPPLIPGGGGAGTETSAGDVTAGDASCSAEMDAVTGRSGISDER